MVKHFPYVHTADKAFVQAKDVTRVPPSYDDYINPGRTAFKRNISLNNCCSAYSTEMSAEAE